MFLCDNRLSSSSLRKSPPVPVRVCSRSPVKIWRQKRERSAARMVNPEQRRRESGWKSEERSTEWTSVSVVLGMCCARHRAY